MRPDLSCYRDLMVFIWIHGNPYVFHVLPMASMAQRDGKIGQSTVYFMD